MPMRIVYGLADGVVQKGRKNIWIMKIHGN